MAAGATGSVDFVVTVDLPVPTGFTNVTNTATIDDDDTYGVDVVEDSSTYDVAITTGAMGDRIWIDLNEDGVQDGGETGAPAGTVVNLLDQTGAAILDTDGNAVTTTTGVDGAYDFDGLPAGDYRVEVVAPAGYSAFDGATIDRTLAAGGDVNDADIPINARAEIGDKVWIDANGDGIQGETDGLDGVTVRLLDSAGDPVQSGGADVTDVTSGGGLYSFPGLLPGTYQVELIESSLPAGYAITTAQNSGDIAVGPPTSSTPPTSGSMRSARSRANSGSTPTNPPPRPVPRATTGWPVSEISLLDGLGAPVLDGGGLAITTLTDADGNYSFTGLLADTYQTAVTRSAPGRLFGDHVAELRRHRARCRRRNPTSTSAPTGADRWATRCSTT